MAAASQESTQARSARPLPPTPPPPRRERPRLSAAEARRLAREMAPRLAERAAEAERQRRCPQETIDELHESGLLRIMQPARFGGSELGLDAHLNVVYELAKGCASTAWSYSNLASHAWNIGQFELQAQEDVWGDDPDAVAATGLAFPCGKARPVDGGYRVSGYWPFASGVDAASWMLVGALTERSGSAPERRFFLVPREDFEQKNNWEALGLCATGSHDVEVPETFVPEHRSISAELFAAGRDVPGAKLYDNPIFATPTFAAFSYVLCVIPIGVAAAAVEQFTQAMRARAGTYTGARLAELGPVQARIAEASACAEFAETVVRRDWRELEEGVRNGVYPSMETKLRWRRNSAFATTLAVRTVDTLMPAAGAGGLNMNLPLQRQFRDIRAGAAHIGLTWDVHAAAYGQSALGLEPAGGLLL
ncbi:MAG: acyl-CoA dehydrogenase family protein [Burkholderiaceae bacterium]|nr:acyl-CoA dehydrogenase family protein [Burkholderiaceae bacterium]